MYAHLSRRSQASALFGLISAILVATVATAEEPSLQDIAKAAQALPQIVIYPAGEIVTLNPQKPNAQAVAVVTLIPRLRRSAVYDDINCGF